MTTDDVVVYTLVVIMYMVVFYLATLGRYRYPFRWRHAFIMFVIAFIPIVQWVVFWYVFKGIGVWRRKERAPLPSQPQTEQVSVLNNG